MIIYGLIGPRETKFINTLNYQVPPSFDHEASVSMNVIFKYSSQNIGRI